MKKIYAKPEIIANAYAEFENIMTFACTMKYADSFCHTHPDLKPGNGGPGGGVKFDPCDTTKTIQLTGQSDFPCAHNTANFS